MDKKILKKMSQWNETLSEKMEILSKPQAKILAGMSFAMVLCRCCGLTTITAMLAKIYSQKETAVKQRIREWYCDAKDKKGKNRVSLDVEMCFPSLVSWILSMWKANYVPLAIDATALSSKFAILVVSVVYRGFAIPVAWKMLVAYEKCSWTAHWLRLLECIKPGIPSHFFVFVMADRGLYSPTLFKHIVNLNWHPFFRVNSCRLFREKVEYTPRVLRTFLQSSPCAVSGFFGNAHLASTLLVWKASNAKEPWFILTDFSPADPCWYSLRFCIEQGFRTIKRGFWLWHNTKMVATDRAERLWLSISVATIYLAICGSSSDDAYETIPFPFGEKTLLAPKKTKRRLSILRRSWIHLIFSLFNESFPSVSPLIPEPLPCSFPEFVDKPPNFF